MSKKFDSLMAECARINPDSLTSTDAARMRSVEDGLRSAPTNWTGLSVLVLGAGDGHEVKVAEYELGWCATGLTFLQGEADAAKGALVVGDVHDLPFADKSFDCVYSKEVMEHSPCPFLALLEINRVLRPGGEFCHLIPWGWDKQRDWYHFSCLPPEVWCDLHRKAYMTVQSVSMQPDCERCTHGNLVYTGFKRADRVLGRPVEEYKQMLGFTHSKSSEGLL